jgi:hypothetical protein
VQMQQVGGLSRRGGVSGLHTHRMLPTRMMAAGRRARESGALATRQTLIAAKKAAKLGIADEGGTLVPLIPSAGGCFRSGHLEVSRTLLMEVAHG